MAGAYGLFLSSGRDSPVDCWSGARLLGVLGGDGSGWGNAAPATPFWPKAKVSASNETNNAALILCFDCNCLPPVNGASSSEDFSTVICFRSVQTPHITEIAGFQIVERQYPSGFFALSTGAEVSKRPSPAGRGVSTISEGGPGSPWEFLFLPATERPVANRGNESNARARPGVQIKISWLEKTCWFPLSDPHMNSSLTAVVSG